MHIVKETALFLGRKRLIKHRRTFESVDQTKLNFPPRTFVYTRDKNGNEQVAVVYQGEVVVTKKHLYGIYIDRAYDDNYETPQADIVMKNTPITAVGKRYRYYYTCDNYRTPFITDWYLYPLPAVVRIQLRYREQPEEETLWIRNKRAQHLLPFFHQGRNMLNQIKGLFTPL